MLYLINKQTGCKIAYARGNRAICCHGTMKGIKYPRYTSNRVALQTLRRRIAGPKGGRMHEEFLSMLQIIEEEK